jgi:hypothetical protein
VGHSKFHCPQVGDAGGGLKGAAGGTALPVDFDERAMRTSISNSQIQCAKAETAGPVLGRESLSNFGKRKLSFFDVIHLKIGCLRKSMISI